MKLTVQGMLIAALLGVLGGHFALAQEEESGPMPNVKVLGLVVAKPDVPGVKYANAWMRTLAPGVTFLLRAEAPGSYLIKLLPDECKLESLTDDQGTDLEPKKDWLDKSPSWFDERSACHFTLQTDRHPAEGAQTVALSAKVAFQVGLEEKTTEKTVDLRVGREMDLGSGALMVKRLELGDWKKTPFRVTLHTEAGFDAIREVTFLDAEGNPVEGKEVVRDYSGKARTYGLERVLEEVTIRCVHFAEVKTVVFPIAVKCRAGFIGVEGGLPDAGIEVEPVGMTVAVGNPDDRRGGSYFRNVHPGVALRLRLRASGARILQMERRTSKLGFFRDGAGAPLVTKGPMGDKWLEQWPRLSEDGKICEIEVRALSLPAPGTASAEVEAGVDVFLGSEEKTETVTLPLEKGAKFEFGKLPVRVASVSFPKSGRRKVEFSLESKGILSRIREVKFRDASGKVVEGKSTGSSSGGTGIGIRYRKSFGLYRKVEAVTMEITYFSKVEPVTVPIEAKVTAGLDGGE